MTAFAAQRYQAAQPRSPVDHGRGGLSRESWPRRAHGLRSPGTETARRRANWSRNWAGPTVPPPFRSTCASRTPWRPFTMPCGRPSAGCTRPCTPPAPHRHALHQQSRPVPVRAHRGDRSFRCIAISCITRCRELRAPREAAICLANAGYPPLCEEGRAVFELPRPLSDRSFAALLRKKGAMAFVPTWWLWIDRRWHVPRIDGRGDFDESFIEATKRSVALGRLGHASEIAQAVAFLASRRSQRSSPARP